jgi:biopolymer transport protein ExbD
MRAWNRMRVAGMSRWREASMQWGVSAKIVFSVLLVFLLAGAAAQANAQIHIPSSVSQPQGTGSPPVTSTDDVQQQQARAANLQRLAEIRRDTEKMSELAQELKAALEKTDPNVVSADAIKKAEQIEKLAHSVKSKMKQSF